MAHDYCRRESLVAAARGAKIMSGSQAASGAASQPPEPSDWQPSTTIMKIVTTRQAQADRDERVAVGARDDERQAEE